MLNCPFIKLSLVTHSEGVIHPLLRLRLIHPNIMIFILKRIVNTFSVEYLPLHDNVPKESLRELVILFSQISVNGGSHGRILTGENNTGRSFVSLGSEQGILWGKNEMVDRSLGTFWCMAFCSPHKDPHRRRNAREVLLTSHGSPYWFRLVSALDQHPDRSLLEKVRKHYMVMLKTL